MDFTRSVTEALSAPFPEDEIEYLPRAVSGGKALAIAYIEARSVMRRLDTVVGAPHWSFDFEPLTPDCKRVKGRLTVLGVTKCDAGEAAGEDEALKSAVSDALKRCAVHFGVGRYLYYLPSVWTPYDAQRRRFAEPPRLDPQALARALALCGVGGAAAPAWPVAETSRETGAVPESSGDRAAQGDACEGSGCARSITRGQRELSVRVYGRPLCPACQKLTAKA
jgi:hypothetical protein